MAKTIYPLDYILKLLLDGKVQEGTQALSDYVEDQKQKRGKAGRAGSREKKSAAAKRNWANRNRQPTFLEAIEEEARQGRGSDAEQKFIDSVASKKLAMTREEQAWGIYPASEMQAMKTAHAVLFGGKLPPGVMNGSEMEGRG